MLAIRLYVCALTFLFLVLVTTNRGLGILEAVVITCTILYMILDVRTDLQALKNELRLLKELEKHLAIRGFLCATSVFSVSLWLRSV